LRERREDVPLLVRHFVNRAERRHGVRVEPFGAGLMRRLIDHGWPGNVRELANVVERLGLASGGGAGRAGGPPGGRPATAAGGGGGLGRAGGGGRLSPAAGRRLVGGAREGVPEAGARDRRRQPLACRAAPRPAVQGVPLPAREARARGRRAVLISGSDSRRGED